jgi:hypothetical protein
MVRLSRLVLAGVAAVLSGRARAADLPPAPSLPLLSPSEAEFGGWYLRGDVGASANATAPEFRIAPDAFTPGVAGGFISGAATQTFGNTTLSPFGMVDIGGGYQFTARFAPTRRSNIAEARASSPRPRLIPGWGQHKTRTPFTRRSLPSSASSTAMLRPARGMGFRPSSAPGSALPTTGSSA